MTKIEDMSEMERESWTTLLADGAVFLYFLQKTTHGFSPRLVHTDMAEFGGIIVRIIILTIILHVAISLFFEMRKRNEPYEKDERDTHIERKGAHWGYRVIQYGIGAIIVTMLLQSGVGADYTPAFSLEKPAEIIFALLVISYVADLVKHGIMIHAYRT